jgi:hypothetical protein
MPLTQLYHFEEEFFGYFPLSRPYVPEKVSRISDQVISALI